MSSPISDACVCVTGHRGERLPLPLRDVPETVLLTGVMAGLTLLLCERGESRAPLGACFVSCLQFGGACVYGMAWYGILLCFCIVRVIKTVSKDTGI